MASSLAMLSAFVTTVTGPPAPLPGVTVAGAPPRLTRARATSIVVVPPLSATVASGPMRAAAARPMRRFSGALREVLYSSGSSCASWVLPVAPPRVRVSIR
jgi:hypothetical protein